MTDIEILNLKEIKELIEKEYKDYFYGNSFISKNDFYFKINQIEYKTKRKNLVLTDTIVCFYSEYGNNNNKLIREKWIVFNIIKYGFDNIIKAYRRNLFIDKII